MVCFYHLFTEGSTTSCSVLSLSTYLGILDGPSYVVGVMQRSLGHAIMHGGLVVGTFIKSMLGMQTKPFGKASHAVWQGGSAAAPPWLLALLRSISLARMSTGASRATSRRGRILVRGSTSQKIRMCESDRGFRAVLLAAQFASLGCRRLDPGHDAVPCCFCSSR